MEDQEPLGREYLLHEEIGRGAHAVVRRATSRLGGPALAAKLLKPEYSGDRRVRELFIREEAALRDLEHTSIVGIRDVVVERGRLALLMDYVDGPNLRRYLTDRGGSLPAPRPPGSPPRPPRRWPSRTCRVWCTSTSNRRTSWWYGAPTPP